MKKATYFDTNYFNYRMATLTFRFPLSEFIGQYTESQRRSEIPELIWQQWEETTAEIWNQSHVQEYWWYL